MPEERPNGLHDRKRLRVFALLPMVYGDNYGFWNRDMGLVVRSLRALGHDAWLVALYDEAQVPGPDQPLIRATLKELEDPAWWQKEQPDFIILNTWAATRFEALRSAALSLKKPVVEKLDTDGVKSPRVWFYRYFRRASVEFTYSDGWLVRIRILFRAILRTSVMYYFPSLLDRKMVKEMSRVPVFVAETPLAVARVKRFLRLLQATPMPRGVTISHPANTEEMRWMPGDAKENIVVAVGRWNEAYKGWPLLIEIAKRFTAIRPDWKVMVVGKLPPFSAGLKSELEAVTDRLIFTGVLNHQELSALNRRARIYLLTSVFESFNIAAAEALCCGCSVVGPAQIASVSYFAGAMSGTPSYLRTPDHMTDALVAEADEWDNNRRDPTKISEVALQRFDAEVVAKAYLKIFEELAAPAS